MLDDSELQARLIQVTRDLILIQSTDSRPEERRRCFQWLRNHLEDAPDLEIRGFECNGYESMLALPRGQEKPEILLAAHLDVVEHRQPDSYRSEVRDGRIIGPGAGDMKGELAILLELMHHLHHQHPGISVGLAVTSDEELGGWDGLRYLVEEEGLRCGLAIIPDGGSLTDIIVEEKGIVHLRVQAPGISAHAARPWLGDNPLRRLMERLGAVSERFDSFRTEGTGQPGDGDYWFPTCTVTIVETENESPNRIPSHASAVLDIRYTAEYTEQDLTDLVVETAGDSLSIERMSGSPPTCLDPDPRFVDATRETTGKEVHLVKTCGGSDARYLYTHGIPVMLSRPEVGNLHGEDEWIDINSMVSYFHICRTYVNRVLGV